MEELELLKKDWKNQEKNFPHIEAKKVLKMIHKRSSSITKWILIIGILEFVFWIGITFLTTNEDSLQRLKSLHFYEFNIILSAIHYIVLITFIYYFYKNYKRIHVAEGTKYLMRNILRVRKTVKYYVIYNIAMSVFVFIAALIATLTFDPKIHAAIQDKGFNDLILPILLSVGLMLIFILLFWLFYKLLYGILLRRLYRNYKELNKLELND